MRLLAPSLFALSLSLLAPPVWAQTQNDQNYHPPRSGTAVASGEHPAPPAKGEVNAPYLPGFDPPAAAPAAPAAAPAGATTAEPSLDEEAGAVGYLDRAAAALAQGQSSVATVALGRVETRLLSQSVPLFQTNRAPTTPAIALLRQARQAIRAGDLATAQALVARARPLVAQEEAQPPQSPPVGLPTAPAPAATVPPQAAPQPVPAPAPTVPPAAAPAGSVLGTAPGALPAPEPMTR